jgi:HIP---CoA ligase
MADYAYPKRTMPDVVATSGRIYGAKDAIVTAAGRISYADLAATVRRTAAALIHLGLEPGDRVAIWAPNSLEWIIALFGIQHAGGVLCPINTRYKGEEAAFVLNRTKARFLFMVERFLDVDYPAMIEAADLPQLEQTVLLPWEESPTSTWEAFLDAATEADLAEADRRLAALGEDDRSDILFTSGTTGEPKGVVTCHGQNVRAYEQWVKGTGLCREDRFLSAWPLFHCAGYKSAALTCMISGATLYQETVLDAERMMRLVEAEQITVLPGPPTLFQTLMAQCGDDTGRLASLRVSVTGAATIPPAVIDAMRGKLGIRIVLTAYGMTETCGMVTMTEQDDSAEVVVTTSGHPIAGIEVEIRDAEGKVLPVGEEGEIMVRGFCVMQGYLDDPAATAEAITADGWLHTGDIGALTDYGYLRITDRKKHMFIVGGFNAYPAEIEAMLLRHEGIGQVAVIGVPDERLGEVGKAFIVPAAGASLQPAEIIAWARERMANYKAPRYVELVDSLPITPTGKVQKFRL